MIDLYDVLGVGLDAELEDIKKAFRRKSLENHPDKVAKDAQEAAAERFNAVKIAKDVLEDPERRKVYDTFGTDLGEERPEIEVFQIGLGTMVTPYGTFLTKSFVAQFIVWLITFWWVRWLLVIVGLVAALFYRADVTLNGYRLREQTEILLHIVIMDAMVVCHWMLPLLTETIGIVYLVGEVVGVDSLFALDAKIGIAVALASALLAWLCRSWWFWILSIEVAILVIMLMSLTVAAGIMRMWIDHVQAQRGGKLKAWRVAMREERRKLADENGHLKRRLQEKGLLSDPALVEAQRKRIVEDQGNWDKKIKDEVGGS